MPDIGPKLSQVEDFKVGKFSKIPYVNSVTKYSKQAVENRNTTVI